MPMTCIYKVIDIVSLESNQVSTPWCVVKENGVTLIIVGGSALSRTLINKPLVPKL